jgi:predicted PolB exonuclease-like 3'-5' exonuclease
MRDQPNRPMRPSSSILAYDLETISTAEPADGSFPPWPTHRIIAAGFARAELKDGAWCFDLVAQVAKAASDEASLIEAVDQRLATAEVAATFNGRGFDAVALRISAIRERRFSLPALAAHAGARRYAPEHADLADLLSSHGAARRVSLAEICAALGVPVKTQAHGSDVAELWNKGERDRIRAYVLEDAAVTLIVYFSWLGFQAADETLVTRPLAALARHIESTPELAFLAPLAECELLRWARPRALRADVSDALARATQRLKRVEDERSFAPAG